jgi:hypothetical protein
MADKIKSVMSGIKLPESAIPKWAQVIPEENWKTLLDSKINEKLPSTKDTRRENSEK